MQNDDDTGLDYFLLTTDRNRLRERIEHIEIIVTGSKNSRLLKLQSSSNETSITDTSNEESSSCMSKKEKESSSSMSKRETESSSKPEDIDDFHKPLERKVFGRKTERDRICGMFRSGPDRSSCRYSVIGLYGVAGSGKSTLAQYVRDHERYEGNYFNLVMSTQVSISFRLDAILRDMLEQMPKDRPSDDKSRLDLQEEVKKNLKGKRFLLVLDDVWVNKKGSGAPECCIKLWREWKWSPGDSSKQKCN